MRQPDLIIGAPNNPQTLRWHLFRWRGVQIALHHWHRSDGDRALHDHSADNISVLLWGFYWEVFANGSRKLRVPFIPYYRRAETAHRVELLRRHYRERPVWSLWIRFKPRREWGFHCPKGWRHWREYISGDYNVKGTSSTVGRGCD